MPGSSTENRPYRREAVIFDVDGTLCDVGRIRKFVEAPPGATSFRPDFHRFHMASAGCPPHMAVKQLARRVHTLGYASVVVTGREAKWRQLTAEWLSLHDIPCDELQTRGSRDYRPDHAIKAEIARDLRERFDCILAVDDRPDIIAVWNAVGIATVQVTGRGELLPVQAAPGTNLNSRVRELVGGGLAS